MEENKGHDYNLITNETIKLATKIIENSLESINSKLTRFFRYLMLFYVLMIFMVILYFNNVQLKYNKYKCGNYKKIEMVQDSLGVGE
jgi:hypothetical protein